MRDDDDIRGDELEGDDILGDDTGADEIVGDDILGDEIGGDQRVGEDILGDDLLGDAEVGAIFRRRRRRRRQQQAQAQKSNARQNAITARKFAASRVVVKRPLTKSRVQSVGFNFTAVGPGATVDIPARPQVKFRGTRLSVPSSIATAFLIEDLKVGRNSQFVAAGAQSAETFKDTATSDNVAMDTCDPGMDIIISVTNTSGTASDFHATLFGDAVE
jgi:hypothetical protein